MQNVLDKTSTEMKELYRSIDEHKRLRQRLEVRFEQFTIGNTKSKRITNDIL